MIAARLLLDAHAQRQRPGAAGAGRGPDEFEAQAPRPSEDPVAGLAALPTDVLARHPLPTESDDARRRGGTAGSMACPCR